MDNAWDYDPVHRNSPRYFPCKSGSKVRPEFPSLLPRHLGCRHANAGGSHFCRGISILGQKEFNVVGSSHTSQRPVSSLPPWERIWTFDV
jgi:hypothetical protein